MFKSCPTCGFLVALIAGREASQRCPRCGSGLVGENETLDAPPDDAPRRRRRDSDEPRAVVPARQAEPVEVDEPAGPPAETEAGVAGAIDMPVEDAIHDIAPERAPEPGPIAPAPAAHDGPSFVRRRSMAPARRGRRWPWIAALAALALLLALQLLLSQRTQLARDATWRPVVVRACNMLGCNVPAWHEPHAWRMLARGVHPDKTRRGVLHVSAALRNDAAWPQRPPVVVLSLSDLDGRLVGARAVPPDDYGRPPTQVIAPGQSVDIAFDVREPSGRVESFDFQLQ